MKRLPVLCLLLALLLPLAACVSSPNESTLLLYKPAEPRTHTVEDQLDPSELTLPLNDAVTLTALWPTQHSEVKDAGEITFLAEASRRTNIRWEFYTPAYGNEWDSYAIQIASGRYPDLLKDFYRYAVYSFDFYIQDGVIQPLDGYEAYMPNIMRWRNASEPIRRALTSDSGRMMGIPGLVLNRGTALRGGSVYGYALRSDWLDALGLALPETYLELETVLHAMQNYTPHPMDLRSNADDYALTAGFGLAGIITNGWIVKDGKVKASVFEEDCRDYVLMLRNWVEHGYVRPDYYATSSDTKDNIGRTVRGEQGVFFCSSRNVEQYYASAADDRFALAPIPPLRRSLSDTIHVRDFGSGACWAAFVTPECVHPEYVCAFFDYLFTDEGILLSNYGTEGDTFTYENGDPVYTERYRQAEAQFGVEAAQCRYFNYMSPGVMWWDRDTTANRTVIDYAKVWDADAITDGENAFPKDAAMTGEESSGYNKAIFEPQVYITEQIPRFITGERPMSEWNDFLEKIRSLGLDDAQPFLQQAYDRYSNR